MKTAILAGAALLSCASAAPAAEPVTVQALLSKGFEVRGAITTEIGPGIFLEEDKQLYLCFVAETPTSTDVKTNYCKPVH